MAERALPRAITSLKRAHCAQMFFIYPGRAAALHGQGVTFLSMVGHAGLGDRNLALVADPYCENYTRGVSPEIADLPSLLQWHKNLLQEFPHVTEFYHLGHSSGGYGALLFGHLLGARKVWAFAPRTARLDTADAAKAFLKEHLSAGTGATEHVIYYSPANRRDCAFAEYFGRCPGVMLLPYMVPPPDLASSMDGELYYHRGVLQTMIDSGDLRRSMPAFSDAKQAVLF